MNDIDETMKKSQGILHSIHFHKVFHAKLAKTSVLCYAWISLGLYSEVLGPTLPTLMHNTNSDYDQIGMALSTRAIGLLFGSLIGGFLSDRYKALRAIFIMISLGVGAITTLIIPWCTNVIILTIVLFIAGLSHGFLTTNGNPLLASIWEEKAAGPFSLMHSGYGMGAAIAPLLAKPFTISFNSSINNHSIISNGTNSTELVLVNAVIPYSIIAGIILFNVLYFLFIVCIDHSTSLRYNGITSVKSNDKQQIQVKIDSAAAALEVVGFNIHKGKIKTLRDKTKNTNAVTLDLETLGEHIAQLISDSYEENEQHLKLCGKESPGQI